MADFSLVVTVRNDREGLRELLPALEAQTLAPAELIIVDGGSVDGTLEVLEGWNPERFEVRVVVEPGSNIAQGRNVAVRLARHDWIACTDAGCRPEPGWLAALAAASSRADVVAGTWVADGRTPLEEVVALTHYPVVEEIGDAGPWVRLSHRLFGRRFEARHAGGRSMVFSKRAWLAAGGFPERQYAGEDLAFTAAIIESGYRATLAPDARVQWRPRGTWLGNARMFYTYCRGDIRSRPRLRHLLRFAAWTTGPALLLRGGRGGRAIALAGALAYVWLPLSRARRARLAVREWWRIPVAVAVKDVSQMLGALRGLGDAIRGIPQPNPQPAPPAGEPEPALPGHEGRRPPA